MIIDEDVPGGASAYLLDKIVNEQNAYDLLDSKPLTLTAKAHRPAYGTDGEIISQNHLQKIFLKLYIMLCTK